MSCSPFRVPIARLSAAQAVLAGSDTPSTRKAVTSRKAGTLVGPAPGSVLAVAIPEEDVARVRAATDIVALIGEHAALKRQGTRWVGLCPFHQEKSPSFSVNAEEGLYYCFGCQKSGDAISFVRDVEHLDFVEAVRRLADRAGVTITEDAAVTAERQRRNPLYDAMTKAVDFYHERLLAAPDGGPARDYLRSRGYDGDVVRAFKLGWAPEGWDALASHLKVSEKVLTDSGLGFVNRRGRRQDAFRGRVIFPIFDPSGKAIALGGRILPSPAGRRLPTGPSTRTPRTAPSTPSAARCTGSTGPRPTWWPAAR